MVIMLVLSLGMGTGEVLVDLFPREKWKWYEWKYVYKALTKIFNDRNADCVAWLREELKDMWRSGKFADRRLVTDLFTNGDRDQAFALHVAGIVGYHPSVSDVRDLPRDDWFWAMYELMDKNTRAAMDVVLANERLACPQELEMSQRHEAINA